MRLIIAGAMLVAASFSIACYDPDDYLLNVEGPAELELSSNAASVRADGFSSVQISAVITGRVERTDSQVVVFTTDAGTLFAGDVAEGTILSVRAARDSIAVVGLRAGNVAGPVTVSAQLLGRPETRRTVELAFDVATGRDIITEVEHSDAAPADGATDTPISITLASNVPHDRRQLVVQTTRGSFHGGEGDSIVVRPVSGDTATVLLVSPGTAGAAIITVRAAGFERRTSLQFTAAPPTGIKVVPQRPSVKAGNEEIQIAIRLTRTIGSVTPGHQVELKAVDETGVEIGRFRDQRTSDGEGVATAQFSTGQTVYRGDIRVVATTLGITGPIADTAYVRVMDP